MDGKRCSREVNNNALEFYTNEKNSPVDTLVINAIDSAVWEYEAEGRKVTWSDAFYHMLGYSYGEIECSYDNFINNLLYHRDKDRFLKTLKTDASIIVVEIRLFTSKGYQWFKSTFQNRPNGVMVGTLINIHERKLLEQQVKRSRQHIIEANHLARLASWEIDLASGKLKLSVEGFEILELHNESPMTIEELISFYEPEHRPIITRDLNACIQYGRPFDVDLRIRSVKNNSIWVKTKALANIDDEGHCISVKGMIQDIDLVKQHEARLSLSLRSTKRQNKRLQSFAHVVTHNLRSYAGNLGAMIGFYDDADSEEERDDIFARIKTISTSLTTAIGHLNEIVKVEFDIKQLRTDVEIEPVFLSIIDSLQGNIQAVNAQVTFDFSNGPEVWYLPAYLESILHNLLSNALKYRHPDRQPVIVCKSVKEDGHVYFTIEDNGLGIDLQKYQEKIFGMYQTFHRHADAHGIGLFLIRNQIEALGGSISVESTVNVGTKFTVKLT